MHSSKNSSDMSYTYTEPPPLPPKTRSSQSSFEGLTPEQEWAKIADAAERRKIQNRNAQRKYRHNLKKRVEALEQHQRNGGLVTPRKSTTPEATTKPEPQNNANSPPQMDMASTKEASMSPRDQNHGLGLMTSVSNSSLPSLCDSSSLDNDWMCNPQFITSNPTHLNPSSLSLSASPEQMSHFQMMEQDKPQLMLGLQPVRGDSLDDYIQHNSTLIEDMCGSESISSDDLEMMYTNSSDPTMPIYSKRSPKASDSSIDPASGRTTLHLAAMKGYIQIVQMLLEKGIDINTRDSKGYTALHLAVEKGQFAVVKLLLDRGADYYARV